jgi:hypothetical protein
VASRPPERNYYEEFLAEREEIRRYKWVVSEEEGRDIGFERALTEWVAKHRQAWREKRQAPAGA